MSRLALCGGVASTCGIPGGGLSEFSPRTGYRVGGIGSGCHFRVSRIWGRAFTFFLRLVADGVAEAGALSTLF